MKNFVKITTDIFSEKYPHAKAVFLAGSIMRGEGTSTSDLDLVVVFDSLPCAYRESYLYENIPIEAFVHDPQTLEYFLREVDRPTGIPSLATMVAEGVEIPEANTFTDSLKKLVGNVLEEGPPKWNEQDRANSRYRITDQIDDIRDPRSIQEMHATATSLYSDLANHYFRSRNSWSAKGKAIPRRLRVVDPAFASKYFDSFESIFSENNSKEVIELAVEILEKDGGFLFEGHRLEAPESWRVG